MNFYVQAIFGIINPSDDDIFFKGIELLNPRIVSGEDSPPKSANQISAQELNHITP